MSKSKFAEFEAEIERSATQTRCKLCNWFADPSTGAEDAAFIRGLLAQPITVKGHTHISKVLDRGGVQISPDAVKSHREAHMDRA